MGNAPYVQFLSPIVLSIQVASDGECSLLQCRGDWERSQSVRMGNGEYSQCSFPLAGSGLYRSGLGWKALPIQGTGQLGAVSMWRMGSAPYVQSLSPIVLSIQVASDGKRSLSQCRGDWERSQSVRMGNGECSQCSFSLVGSALYRSGLGWGVLPIQRNGQFGAIPL
jgi:hypothetical protein